MVGIVNSEIFGLLEDMYIEASVAFLKSFSIFCILRSGSYWTQTIIDKHVMIAAVSILVLQDFALNQWY